MLEIRLKYIGRTWIATAVVNGKTHRIRAMEGAGNKLARMLKSQGVPDQPVNIVNPTGNVGLSSTLYGWASFDLIRARGDDQHAV